MPKHASILLYVHGNQKVRSDGQHRTATSTLTQFLNYNLVPRSQLTLIAFTMSGPVWRNLIKGVQDESASLRALGLVPPLVHH